jgi:hypothetical protein
MHAGCTFKPSSTLESINLRGVTRKCDHSMPCLVDIVHVMFHYTFRESGHILSSQSRWNVYRPDAHMFVELLAREIVRRGWAFGE